jgi:hypothetical protein
MDNILIKVGQHSRTICYFFHHHVDIILGGPEFEITLCNFFDVSLYFEEVDDGGQYDGRRPICPLSSRLLLLLLGRSPAPTSSPIVASTSIALNGA